MLKIITFLLFK